MAIVKTIQSGTATVNIDTGCCAAASAEEIERRWAEIDRVIMRINRKSAEGGTGSPTTASGPTPH